MTTWTVVLSVFIILVSVGVVYWRRKRAPIEISLDDATPLSDEDVRRLVAQLQHARRRVLEMCEGDTEVADHTWKRVVAEVEQGWTPVVVEEAEARLGLFDQKSFPPGSLPHFETPPSRR